MGIGPGPQSHLDGLARHTGDATPPPEKNIPTGTAQHDQEERQQERQQGNPTTTTTTGGRSHNQEGALRLPHSAR
jgi:hypothetical protein